jgi:hypothetical protein
MVSGIIKHESALNFIFGGKSFVTFLNTSTENRFTYKVVKHKIYDLYFVNVLTNPDTYTFIGSVKNNVYKHSIKSHIKQDSQSVKVFTYVIDKLQKNQLSELIEIYHDGKCGKCGRQLTVPESIETGFGPECFKTINKVEKRNHLLNSLLK